MNSTMFVALVYLVSADAAPAIETTGSCPSAEAVSATIAPLLASLAARQWPEGTVRVDDLGDRFEVAAAGQTGQYVDAARDCSERARVAAVFIALALNPPAAPTTPRVEAPLPAAAPEVEAVGSAWWVRLALGGRIEHSPTDDGRSSPAASVGAELGAALGRGAFGMSVAGGVLAPTVVTFGSVPVREQRSPFRVAAVVRHKVGRRFELGGELGLSLVLLRLRGEDLDTVEPATRLDVGGRAALAATLWPLASSWAPFLAVHGEYFPRPYEFEVGPLGRIGSTSRLWIGASAGVSWQNGPARYPARQ